MGRKPSRGNSGATIPLDFDCRSSLMCLPDRLLRDVCKGAPLDAKTGSIARKEVGLLLGENWSFDATNLDWPSGGSLVLCRLKFSPNNLLEF